MFNGISLINPIEWSNYLIRIVRVKPHLHLFGHIHSQYGMMILNNITFSNGAIMNADYSNLRSPNLIDVF